MAREVRGAIIHAGTMAMREHNGKSQT
jgi:hypothetical protein